MNGISLSAADTCRGPLVLVNAQHPYRGGAPALSPALGAEDILLEKTAAALLAECVRAAGAVSYTHLDVYKRQVRRGGHEPFQRVCGFQRAAPETL